MSAREVREFVPFTVRVYACALLLSLRGKAYQKERQGKRANDDTFDKRKVTSRERKDNQGRGRHENKEGKLWVTILEQLKPYEKCVDAMW